MSYIIEITGPPSVGKSTIYKAIVKNWNRNHSWIPADRLLPVVSDVKFGTVKHFIQLGKKAFGIPWTDKTEIINAAYRFLDRHPDFVALCWDLIDRNRKSDHLNVDNRFRSAYYLYLAFGKFQAISEAKDERFAISDELLMHRIIQITEESIQQDQIEKFVQLLPKPISVILLDAPAKIIAQRAADRKRSIIRHLNRNESDLIDLSENDRKRFIVTTEILKSHGVDILKIDTTESIESNVAAITDFLSEVTCRHI